MTETELKNMAMQLREIATANRGGSTEANLLNKVANYIDPPRPVTEWSDAELVAFFRGIRTDQFNKLLITDEIHTVFNEVCARLLQSSERAEQLRQASRERTP